MQREQRTNEKFPDGITSKSDDQRLLDAVRRRHRRFRMQPRERPACESPEPQRQVTMIGKKNFIQRGQLSISPIWIFTSRCVGIGPPKMESSNSHR